jgi:hypothetical protein
MTKRKGIQENPPPQLRIAQAVLFALALVSMSAWIFMDFNLGNFALVWISVALGLILGFFLVFFLERRFPMLARFEKVKKTRIGVYVALIFIDLTPLALQQFNSRFFNSRVSCQDYLVAGKASGTHTRHSSGFKIFLSMSSGQETIDCEEGFWNTVVVGKQVRICMAKGALGFYYIKEMSAE